MKRPFLSVLGLILAALLVVQGPAAFGVTFTVLVKNFTYEPHEILIAPGDSIDFHFQSDGRTATGTSGNHPVCGPNQFFSGDHVLVTFTNAATITYHDNSRGASGANGTIYVVSNALPAVVYTELTSTNEYLFSTNVTVAVTADDPDGSTSQVNLMVESTSFALLTSPTRTNIYEAVAPAGLFVVGTNNIRAVATDNRGGKVTNTVVITMVTNSPPAVTVTSPTNDTVYAGPVKLEIAATATEPDLARGGRVTNIDFRIDGVSIGSLTNAVATNTVFAFTNSATIGTRDAVYTVSTVATDERGLSATNSVNIRVAGMLLLSVPQLTTSTAFFQFPSASGVVYNIEWSTNLIDWTVATSVNALGSTTVAGLSHTNPPALYFRIRQK